MSLDLGITTGWAVFKYGEKEYELALCGDADQYALGDRLVWITGAYGIDILVVAEKPVVMRGELGDKLKNVVDVAEDHFDGAMEYVDPGTWKPTPVAKTPLPRGWNAHQKDATHLGMWFCVYKLHLQGAS